MDGPEKPLQSLERLGALVLDQRVPVSGASVAPAPRHPGDVLGAVLAANEVETGFSHQPLVLVAQREDEEPDRRSECDLLAREEAGDDDRVGEQEVAARPEHAMPLPQHRRPVGQVVDRVDADDGVERCLLEREWPPCVGLLEACR